MWNLDTKPTQFIIPMPIFKEYQTIVRKDLGGNTKIRVMMSYLTQEEENLIDANKTIHIKRGELTFDLSPKDIEFYGDVDFSYESDDYYRVDDTTWISSLSDITPIPIPSKYNYKEHTCKSPKPQYLWTETYSPARVAQYRHACLGKPNKVVIFKYRYHGKF